MPNEDFQLGQRVLIWGGTGFIGASLVNFLLRQNANITILTRGDAAHLPAGVRKVSLGFDRSSEARCIMRRAIEDADVIYNLAGSSGAVASNQNPVANLEANCTWQLELLEACREAGHCPHVVFASSRLVYGKPRSLPVDESHVLEPESVYAVHKFAGEQYHRIYAQSGAITYTICRISVAYGRDPGVGTKNHGFLNVLLENAVNGKQLEVFGSGEQLRDYIHVSDLAKALALCGTSPNARNETFNVGSGAGIRIADAARMIGELANVPVVYLTWPEEYRQVETGDFVSDISRLKQKTGFEPAKDFLRGITEEISTLSAALSFTGAVRPGDGRNLRFDDLSESTRS